MILITYEMSTYYWNIKANINFEYSINYSEIMSCNVDTTGGSLFPLIVISLSSNAIRGKRDTIPIVAASNTTIKGINGTMGGEAHNLEVSLSEPRFGIEQRHRSLTLSSRWELRIKLDPLNDAFTIRMVF